MKLQLILLLLLAVPVAVNCLEVLSLKYYPSVDKSVKQRSSSPVVNYGASFSDVPDAVHVADIYCRVAGLPPLLYEGEAPVPSLSLMEVSPKQMPLILAVDGGVLPQDTLMLVEGTALTIKANAPSLDSIVSVLRTHGIEAVATAMNGKGDKIREVNSWIQKQQRPIFIVHRESPSPHHFQSMRSLSAATGGNSTVPLTEFQISQYQICLWTGLILILLILASICSILNMEVIPDSLLYAKFQSGRTGKID